MSVPENSVGASDLTLESNRKTVMAFYHAAINKRDFQAALKYIGQRYVQHNPLVADGVDGLKAFLSFLAALAQVRHEEC
jgi:predicted SnoaL-like aldol condensation-catalyzing enzyme